MWEISVVQLVTLTFKTHQIENMVDFYTALGAELVAKPVKGSATHSYQGRLIKYSILSGTGNSILSGATFYYASTGHQLS